jgi:hypothetical protein
MKIQYILFYESDIPNVVNYTVHVKYIDIAHSQITFVEYFFYSTLIVLLRVV